MHRDTSFSSGTGFNTGNNQPRYSEIIVVFDSIWILYIIIQWYYGRIVALNEKTYK
jgi:hypothetical protein